MNRLRIFSALLPAVALAFAGCERITDADKAAALATVKQNLEAMEARNAEAVAATIHSQSPHFEKTKMLTDQLFKKYELHYELKEAAVESVARDTIRVRFVQDVVKISGPPDFKSTRTAGVHVLRREDGAWKLWSTENQQVTYLEK